MKKDSLRQIAGHLCVMGGVTLLGTALYFAGEPSVSLGKPGRNAVAGAAAIGGGALTFGVGRRLLNRRDEEGEPTEAGQTLDEPDRRG